MSSQRRKRNQFIDVTKVDVQQTSQGRRQRAIKKKRKRNAKRAQNRLGWQELPDIDNKPVQTRCIRYRLISQILRSSSAIFTTKDILLFVGHVTAAATTYYPIIDSFRLLRVGVTVLADSDDSGGSLGFEWAGSNIPQKAIQMFWSIGVPCNKSFYPPDDASASWWWDSSSTETNLFQLYVNTSTNPLFFLDLEIQYILSTGASTSVAISSAPAYTGLAYRRLPQTTEDFEAEGLDVVG